MATAQSLGITFSQGAQATPAGVANAQATGMYSNTPGYSSSPSAAEITNRPNNTTSAPAVTPPAPVPTPTPDVNLNPDNSGAITSNLNTAFNTVKNTPPPQNAGDAASAITTATNQAAQTPTFYKPDPNNAQVYNAQGQAVSHDQYIAQGGKADYSNVQNAAVPTPPATPIQGIQAQLAQDKGYQQLLKDYADYNNVENQAKTLTDSYNEIVKASGLDAINTELLNTQKILDGTEQNIRDEVTAAGGFSTDSQVLALAQARNKTLLQNYNGLVAQQKNITDQVNTMVNLASQDRNFALQSIQNKLQIDQQINDYAQKFQANAQQAYQNVISTVGYSGLYAELANDPNSIALTEETLGLQPGQLKSLAAQQQAQAAQVQSQQNFDNQIKQSELGVSQYNAQTSRISATKDLSSNPQLANQPGYDPSGQKYTINSAANEISQELKGGYVQGNGTISSSTYNQMKSWWTSQNLAGTAFDNQFYGLIDKSDNNTKSPGYWKTAYNLG